MALAMRPERCDSSKLTDGWMVGWLEWYLNDRAMKMNESRAGFKKTKACNSLVLVWHGNRSLFAMSGD